MATTFHCDIVSAEAELFSGSVELLVASATQGDIGIYANHTPLLTDLRPGPIRVRKQSGEEEVYYISGGFLEVQPKLVTVLADTGLREGDLDEAAAVEARREAEKALTGGAGGKVDYRKAAIQLAEAEAQLRTLNAMRKRAGKSR